MTERAASLPSPAEMGADPHAAFARMRSAGPVLWHQSTKSWYVTPYELVGSLLLDRRLSAQPAAPVADVEPDSPVGRIERVLEDWPLFNDPPHQTAARGAILSALKRVRTRFPAEQIERTAQRLLHEVSRSGDGDLVGRFAGPLAAGVTCTLLGFPDDQIPTVREWSDAILGYLASDGTDAAVAGRAVTAAEDVRAYLTESLVPSVRAGIPRWAPWARVAALPVDRAVAAMTQLITGGIDPVVSGLGTLAYEMIRAGNDDAPAEGAVEEALRLGTPFHFITRRATRSIVIDGRRIRPDDRVVLSIAAANRDPDAFPDPDAYRPQRDGPRHLSFGLGSHYCPGATLSRLVLGGSASALKEWLISSAPTLRTACPGSRFGFTTWQSLEVARSSEALDTRR